MNFILDKIEKVDTIYIDGKEDHADKRMNAGRAMVGSRTLAVIPCISGKRVTYRELVS